MTETLTLPAKTEAVEFDHDVLADLCSLHGAEIETFLTEYLLHIGRLIDRTARLLRQGDVARLERTCLDLAELSRTIGMRTVTQAAHAVRDAIAAEDPAALAACGARLVRLGHPAAIETWTVRTATTA
ncbi:hypothetical protein [Jannaschia seohaensis]|uniref:Hpt domain-containing protein n=1 Tax=Jannaschia seohaensis TaxID=475081 RepID=A0A2Y9B1D5_9RHOB|nr:hypothetical protein [Jannaschia seohaensis]PWJ16500.1 hypothetical protein BCF38_10814 [Jannaschia seohaensis]SSA48737.1 hypothetical protein SAMN05421539_10814 [Jannaschia seohaensis]